MAERQRTLQDRLSGWAGKTREQADKLEPSPARDALLKKVAQADEATKLFNWINSPELQPPK